MDGVEKRESYHLNHFSMLLCSVSGERSALKLGCFRNMAAMNKWKEKSLANTPVIFMY